MRWINFIRHLHSSPTPWDFAYPLSSVHGKWCRYHCVEAVFHFDCFVRRTKRTENNGALWPANENYQKWKAALRHWQHAHVHIWTYTIFIEKNWNLLDCITEGKYVSPSRHTHGCMWCWRKSKAWYSKHTKKFEHLWLGLTTSFPPDSFCCQTKQTMQEGWNADISNF